MTTCGNTSYQLDVVSTATRGVDTLNFGGVMCDSNFDSDLQTTTKLTLLQVLVGEPKSPWWGGAGSPLLAAGLSLCLPGLGQLYNREPIKGVLLLVGTFLFWFVLLGWIPQAIAVLEPLYKAYKKTTNYSNVA